MVRIWLPFLMVALLLLYFLAVYVPALQQSTLERFYLSKLQTVALTVDNVVGYGLETYDFRFISAALNDLDSVPLLDRMGSSPSTETRWKFKPSAKTALG